MSPFSMSFHVFNFIQISNKRFYVQKGRRTDHVEKVSFDNEKKGKISPARGECLKCWDGHVGAQIKVAADWR